MGFLPTGLLETEYADEEVSVRCIVISDAPPLKRKVKSRGSWGNYRNGSTKRAVRRTICRNGLPPSRLVPPRRMTVDNQAHSKPSDVDAEQGEVLVDGPGGVAIALTPDAAEETGKRLIASAEEARRQSARPV